ncbi:putative calcineurin-like phosphoesterase [Planoprotostelium fungivorum]|uniref:Putative calcineurin-like phosphoesterase n=1 Tax=Planoprotostelium fungivorum TaxID=1890364 RepID=A0A2P6NM28_9EUKA|nr:putative calcineurin-like phosphoesterase [Planoprotostelium fungivorum]
MSQTIWEQTSRTTSNSQRHTELISISKTYLLTRYLTVTFSYTQGILLAILHFSIKLKISIGGWGDSSVHIFDLILSSTLPHRYRIVIGGNHDKIISHTRTPEETRKRYLSNCTHYLQDTSVDVEGLKVYGAPWHAYRPFWYLSNNFGKVETITPSALEPKEKVGNEDIESKWNAIPSDTDILITHVPPIGVRDKNHKNKPIGSRHLLATDLLRVKPRVHVFGHNHDGFGSSHFKSEDNDKLLHSIQKFYQLEEEEKKAFEIYFINAAQPAVMKPIVFDYYY